MPVPSPFPVFRCVSASVCVLLLASAAGAAETPHGAVDRMYVLECGESKTTDVSNWSPGINVGVAREFSDNCYLIKHGDSLLLWDTGMSDSFAAKPEGVSAAGGILTLFVRKTLAAQLRQLGVAPADITHLAVSHFHGDHVGNANLFTAARLYTQEPEYEAAFGPSPAKFGFGPALYEGLKSSQTVKLNGDHDVFGDGSVVILSTPGHTPGHQSLLVRLPKRGAVVLSGDMVHFDDNWVHRRVPARNFNKEQSVQSMERIAALLAAEHAELWINHDKAQSAGIPKAPDYVE
jgi:glyoxylase-like metal-dependent hydrolase (beta-lactamase superfamily II)